MDDKFVCYGSSIGIGTMPSDQIMLVHTNLQNPEPSLKLFRNELEIHFSVPHGRDRLRYRFKQRLAQIQKVYHYDKDDTLNIIIQLRLPPHVSCQVPRTRTWRRLPVIHRQGIDTRASTSLAGDSPVIDPGRWLAYCFVIQSLRDRHQWEDLASALHIPQQLGDITIIRVSSCKQWEWLQKPTDPAVAHNSGISSSLALLHLADTQVHLPYKVMYQLEVCISHGYLHEYNLDHAFATKLQGLDQNTGIPGMAQYLLEHIAGLKQHFTNPMDIFKHQHEVKANRLIPPSYCISLQSATITPTTIYFHTPAVEMSNRILRKYSQLDRHFLRVKFRDELHFGRVRAADDGSDEEIFQRFARALKYGITVGGRTFHFLAYGNSQLRENGAYFFASTHELNAEDLRKQMGTFSQIKVVAKYASRLGQAFSTTRTAWNQVEVVDIDDINRNGYCFSDGVGKMSLFVARMLAEHLKLPSSAEHCPSAFQFRLGGYKGIIVVDKHLTGRTIQLRPSQNKFPAAHKGLEICRSAQYSATFLNQQIILLLSCLGVADKAIMDRQEEMIADLQTAMHDEHMAVRLLLKSVDQNRTSEALADMIRDGFMTVKEPFFMSCLRLWLSWSVKWLKEKARILIPDGAFLLGCVDETGVLAGHVNEPNPEKKQSSLPKIFVQTSTTDPSMPGKTLTRVTTGLCMVARNPSLHPGDIRVVEAVDVPELHHLRNVVVFPQTGDRDLPGMCSGGDLDGDDYLVIWDPDMIPTEWNHEPMDYTPPTPTTVSSQITVAHITNFFVQHMKHDNLGRIATAHRYWADLTDDGPKDPKCLELAALHSRAVDYAKTGVPAKMGMHLKVNRWPRWANPARVPRNLIYDSDKILHQLYRSVDFVDFVPAQECQFDERILEAYNLDVNMLESARALKREYDTALRRLMSQHEIESEYEVWTAFVLSHNEEVRDWTLAEALGNAIAAIQQQYRSMVFQAAGTNEQEQDFAKLAPYITAMYTVAAQDAEAELQGDSGGKTAFISFPWIFRRELGLIANGKRASVVTNSSKVDIEMAVAQASLVKDEHNQILKPASQPPDGPLLVEAACEALEAKTHDCDDVASSAVRVVLDHSSPAVVPRSFGLPLSVQLDDETANDTALPLIHGPAVTEQQLEVTVGSTLNTTAENPFVDADVDAETKPYKSIFDRF